ncbi:hypothetical protein N7449_011006 [Penicillium cf. viridicatum]|uniref:Uncharacterized protein n=1 Tax=Penicillium cf. viridicatum TaxID=2972119 RepID=A0A9W9IY26_9EURO|nr:hypothetical protein N7449_011006 [Penicillium cf. viridicatum]
MPWNLPGIAARYCCPAMTISAQTSPQTSYAGIARTGRIQMEYLPTTDMFADSLTKALDY